MAKECHKQFNAKTGSIFEDSPIPLDKWLIAIWLELPVEKIAPTERGAFSS